MKRLSAKKFQKKQFLDLTFNPSQNFLSENFTLPQGLTPLQFTNILVKPTGCSSPPEGERAKMF